MTALRRRLGSGGRESRPGPRRRCSCGYLPVLMITADVARRSGQDVDLRRVGTELHRRGAVADHLKPVRDTNRLWEVRCDDQDGSASVSQFGDDAVDFFLGANIDPLGRLGQHQYVRSLDQLAS